MREIVHIQIGQCGNQIGSKVLTCNPHLFFINYCFYCYCFYKMFLKVVWSCNRSLISFFRVLCFFSVYKGITHTHTHTHTHCFIVKHRGVQTRDNYVLLIMLIRLLYSYVSKRSIINYITFYTLLKLVRRKQK